MHRGPILNILPKLYKAQYLSLIDVSLGFHNLKLDEKSSYLITFACQFGRYKYKRLPFGAAPTGYVPKKNTWYIKDLSNAFGIADDILVCGIWCWW